MTAQQERIRQEVHKEHVELVYKFLRTHPDAAMHWVDIRAYPDVEDGDPNFGFWEIYSPTGYTRDELHHLRGDDMDDLAYSLQVLMEKENE